MGSRSSSTASVQLWDVVYRTPDLTRDNLDLNVHGDLSLLKADVDQHRKPCLYLSLSLSTQSTTLVLLVDVSTSFRRQL